MTGGVVGVSGASRGLRSTLLETRITLSGFVIAVLSFVLACPHIMGVPKPWWVNSILAVCIFAIVFLRRQGDSESIAQANRSVGAFFAGRSLVPFVAAASVTVFLITIGASEFTQITRPISMFLQYCCIALLIYAYIWEYGSRAIDRFFYVLCAACIFEFSCGLIVVGPLEFLRYITGASNETVVRQFFELHDMCLSMPLIVVYYLRRAKGEPRHKLKATAALSISLIGGKRIALAALLVVLLISFVLKMGKKRGAQAMEPLVQASLIIAACIWVYMTSTDVFADLCSSFGINSMGRTIIYTHFQRYIDANPLSLGCGMGFCDLHLQSLVGTKVLDGVNDVLGVHNDLLKVLIDCGSLGFAAYLAYFAIYFPVALGKRFGNEAKTTFYLAFTFALITYMTDNTMGYMVFQTVFYLILVPRSMPVRQQGVLQSGDGRFGSCIARRLGRSGADGAVRHV